jgi:hypothetical protein
MRTQQCHGAICIPQEPHHKPPLQTNLIPHGNMQIDVLH